MENLRFATQSEQNSNRPENANINRQEPLEELQAIGIKAYPKHTRYDKSQSRFVVEKHPCLLAAGKKQISSTRTGSVIQRYYDMMKKAIELDKSKDKSPFFDTWVTYSGIANQFNRHIGSSVFNVSFPNIQPNFQSHLCMIENQMEITTKFTNIGEKTNTGIVYNGNVVCEDESMTLTRDMIPKYVNFTKETAKMGCRFSYCRRVDGKNVSKQISASSKSVTLKVKFDEMIENFSKIVV
jgi:hypothetical protein